MGTLPRRESGATEVDVAGSGLAAGEHAWLDRHLGGCGQPHCETSVDAQARRIPRPRRSDGVGEKSPSVTKMYTAVVEVAGAHVLSDDQTEDIAEELEQYELTIVDSPRGYRSSVNVSAETLVEATTTAVAVVEDAFDADAVSCEVATTDA